MNIKHIKFLIIGFCVLFLYRLTDAIGEAEGKNKIETEDQLVRIIESEGRRLIEAVESDEYVIEPGRVYNERALDGIIRFLFHEQDRDARIRLVTLIYRSGLIVPIYQLVVCANGYAKAKIERIREKGRFLSVPRVRSVGMSRRQSMGPAFEPVAQLRQGRMRMREIKHLLEKVCLVAGRPAAYLTVCMKKAHCRLKNMEMRGVMRSIFRVGNERHSIDQSTARIDEMYSVGRLEPRDAARIRARVLYNMRLREVERASTIQTIHVDVPAYTPVPVHMPVRASVAVGLTGAVVSRNADSVAYAVL